MKVKSIIDLGAFGRHEIILSPGAESEIRVGQEVTGRIILVAIAESEDEIMKVAREPYPKVAEQVIEDMIRSNLCQLHDQVFDHFTKDNAVLLIDVDFTGTNGTAAKQYLRPDLREYLEEAVKGQIAIDERKAGSRIEIDGRMFERINDGKVKWFAVKIRSPIENYGARVTTEHANIMKAYEGRRKPKGGVVLMTAEAGQCDGRNTYWVDQQIINILDMAIATQIPFYDREAQIGEVSVPGCYVYSLRIDGKIAFQKYVASTGGENPAGVWKALL